MVKVVLHQIDNSSTSIQDRVFNQEYSSLGNMTDPRLQERSMRYTAHIIVTNIPLFWSISDWPLVFCSCNLLIAGTFDINLTPDKRTILLHEEQTLIKELSVNSAACETNIAGTINAILRCVPT